MHRHAARTHASLLPVLCSTANAAASLPSIASAATRSVGRARLVRWTVMSVLCSTASGIGTGAGADSGDGAGADTEEDRYVELTLSTSTISV